MAGIKLVQRNRHAQTVANAYIGPEGETTTVTETRELRTHDGVTAGGHRILTKDQNDVAYQAMNANLTAFAALDGTPGILVQSALATYVRRTIVVPAAGLSITNASGSGGNPTFSLANDLAALEGLGATGFAVRSSADTWVQRVITVSGNGLSISNGDGVAGDPIISASGDLATLAGFGASAGIPVHTGSNTYVLRTLTAPAAGLTITNPAGTAGNPTFALANDLAALEGLGSTGFAVRSAADTWVQRSLTAPAAGITISNNDGVSGNPTLALANDLAALEGLGSTGIAVRSAADTWLQRTIAAGTGITVTNGDGVAGNPTIAVDPSAVLPPGVVQMYAGSAAPTGWLFCDGSSQLRAGALAALFAIIGTTYGSVDGTHFTLPDFRGRMPIGVGTGAGLTARTLGATGGEETHALSIAELAAHTHSFTVSTPVVAFAGNPAASSGTDGDGVGTTTNSTGSGTAHNTMAPFLVVNYIIKT